MEVVEREGFADDERPADPVVLDEAVGLRSGINEEVGSKAAPIDQRGSALQLE